jgi:rhodanese-related sulfurtransferase
MKSFGRLQLFHRDHHGGHHGHDHQHDHDHDHSHGDDYTSDSDIYPEQFVALFEQGKVGTILDVRDPYEREQVHIKDSVSVPLREMSKHIKHLDPKGTYYLVCTQGFRASYAAQYMYSMGFENIFNVQTGIFGIYEYAKEKRLIPEWLEVQPEWSPKVV